MLPFLLKAYARLHRRTDISKHSNMDTHQHTPLAIKCDSASDTICDICSDVIGSKRQDGSTEVLYKLPCSHVFGSICILRWLEVSTLQDCPNCRRRLVHPGCGHLIMPHNVSTAPPSIPVNETPALCVRCRGEGIVGPALRLEFERLQAQEKALRGIQAQLPKFFQVTPPKAGWSVEERIVELRKGFALFNENAWREFEEMERRERW
jgi:hypothetical protein